MRDPANNTQNSRANRLAADLGATPVAGNGLSGATLAAELGQEPTLLVFLRHYG